MRSRDFWGSAARLVKRLAPQRRLSIAVITLGIAGTTIGVIVPRILGHATDLLFNGVIGRGLPGESPRHRPSLRLGPVVTTPSPTCCPG
ncbi:drug ABC transporter ATP-binding protein [Mycobacterium tuberculosis variant bovis BCG]|nr:drug ABC transporter ATP-binding protein [Mycobacterium tuberculosis variant bovis BCG]